MLIDWESLFQNQLIIFQLKLSMMWKKKTLVSASSFEKDIRNKKIKKMEKSTLIGEVLAKRAKEKNINEVYFDRGENKYHGRVKNFADSLRKNGLKF